MLLPSNALISLANVLLLMGFAEHVGHPMRWRWPVLLMAANVLALSVTLMSPALADIRPLIISLNSIAWDTWIIWWLLIRTPPGLQTSSAFTAAVFFADMLFYAVRAHVYSGDTLGQMSSMAQTLLSTNHLFGTMATMLLTIGLMLMLAQKMMQELRHAADHDALTGLPNRAMFTRLARRAIDQCHVEGLPYVVILCDLDRFKSVNDLYGHGAGDLALKHFSWSIRAAGLPPSAVFSRYGGEEFAVLLPGYDRRGATVLSERLRHMVEQAPLDTVDGVIPMTVSIGAVEAKGLTYEEALEAADVALYAAKHAGRNRVVWSEDVKPEQVVGRDRAWLQPHI